MAKCIDIKSITALQSNNHIDIEVEPGGNATENGDDDNEYDFHNDDDDDNDDGKVILYGKPIAHNVKFQLKIVETIKCGIWLNCSNMKQDGNAVHQSEEPFEVHIRPITNRLKSTDLKRSWMADYLRKPRNDRIMWESKLYKMERSYNAKSLPDKTEELMDLVL